MKQKIGDVEYEIIPIPPSHAVYASLYSVKTKEQPKNLEEAKQISKDVEGVTAILFAECVSPAPKKEHHTQALKALFDLTAKTQEEAGLFRQDSKPHAEKSDTTRPINSQTPKRNPGA